MTVIIDDHLLRDQMVGRGEDLVRELDGERLATTNLWYARLCKSAARQAEGALVGGLSLVERQALTASLIRLPPAISIVPMRVLAWRMGLLVAEHSGLSTLSAEALAAAEALSARLIVSRRDEGPGLRAASARIGIRYSTLAR